MRNNKLDLDFAGWLWAVNRNKVNEYYRDHYGIGNDFKPTIGGAIVKEYFNTNVEILQTAYYFLQINWNTTIWDTYPETFKGGALITRPPLDIYDFTWLLFRSLAYRLKVDDINDIVEGDWRSLWDELDKKYEDVEAAANKEEAELGDDLPELESMTCYNCVEKDVCPYAFDLYNTDGDCLAMK